jgi:hypothetical protein
MDLAIEGKRGGVEHDVRWQTQSRPQVERRDGVMLGDKEADHSAMCHDCEILALPLRYDIGDGFGEALKGGISGLIAYKDINRPLEKFAEPPAQFSGILESETAAIVFVKV